MIKTIMGIFLLALPFILVTRFKDRYYGFISVMFFLIIFESILSILLQLIGIFEYQILLSATILADIFILFVFLKKIPLIKFNIDWFLIAVFVISSVTLYQVHYNYTGKFSMVGDPLFSYHDAKNMQYAYPYFSDEWYAVSLINESIENHSLPILNPFDKSFFMNPEIFFHSFMAGIFLVTGADTLTQYTVVSVFFNVLIIVLIYFLLIRLNISKPISAVSALSVLYITSSANLPGIWNLIPVTMGIILSIIGCLFLINKDFKFSSAAFVSAVLFYPPFIIFSVIGIIIYFLENKQTKLSIVKIIGYTLFFLSSILALVVIVAISPVGHIADYILKNLFYKSFMGDYIPQLIFYNIIPWWIIIFSLIGITEVYKKAKWILAQFLLGVALWIIYMFSVYRFIIGFERVVFFTSIITVIIAGFGAEKIKNYFLNFNISKNFLNFFYVFCLILFVVYIPFYTNREKWMSLVSTNFINKSDSIPMAPANNYLMPEDLRIFKDIKNKKFLSMPWKGTVIGVSTGNFPVLTKGGTITMSSDNPILYSQFMEGKCDKKNNIAKDKHVDYIYSMPFLCPGFLEVDKSSEGFVLYMVNL